MLIIYSYKIKINIFSLLYYIYSFLITEIIILILNIYVPFYIIHYKFYKSAGKIILEYVIQNQIL